MTKTDLSGKKISVIQVSFPTAVLSRMAIVLYTYFNGTLPRYYDRLIK